MSSLTHLPLEELGRIASLVDGSSVLRLALLSGVSLLSQKLFLGTLELHFNQCSPAKTFTDWPRGVRYFSNLSVLSVAYLHRVWVRNIGIREIITLPKSIKHLNFQFDNAVVCWLVRDITDTSSASLIPTSFHVDPNFCKSALPKLLLLNDVLPNLETLALVSTRQHNVFCDPFEDLGLSWSPTLYNRFFSNLPRHLVRLRCDLGISVPPRLFDTLPPRLPSFNRKSLQYPYEFSMFTLQSDVVDGDSSRHVKNGDGTLHLASLLPLQPAFSLTSMKLRNVTVQDVSLLPNTLKVLSVKRVMQADAAKFLPRNLLSLSVTSDCSFTSHVEFADLPRTLTKLKLASMHNWSSFSGLPSALRSLSLRVKNPRSQHPVDWNTFPHLSCAVYGSDDDPIAHRVFPSELDAPLLVRLGPRLRP